MTFFVIFVDKSLASDILNRVTKSRKSRSRHYKKERLTKRTQWEKTHPYQTHLAQRMGEEPAFPPAGAYIVAFCAEDDGTYSDVLGDVVAKEPMYRDEVFVFRKKERACLRNNAIDTGGDVRACIAYANHAKVRLNAGWNAILIQVEQYGGDRALCARFRGIDANVRDLNLTLKTFIQ